MDDITARRNTDLTIRTLIHCRDESNFLIDYLSKNKSDKLEVVALSFEKHDEAKNIELLKQFKKELNILMSILIFFPCLISI